MNNESKIAIMVEGAIMIALALVLSYVKIFEMPYGGSITLEMIPLVIMAFRRGAKWGVLTAFVHSLIQMFLGFSNVLYCPTLFSQIGCILLDYILGFSVLGLAGFFRNIMSNKTAAIITGVIVVCLLRYLCSFISGVWLWGAYAPEGMNTCVYSLVYNGSYMLPDTIITLIVCLLLNKASSKIFK